MRSLWRAWPRLKRRLNGPEKKLLLLDFDGTLAPIAPTPDSVVLDGEVRRLVSQLARSRHFKVGIVSGRSLGDIRRYIKDKRVLCVGNHGLEMQAANLRLPKSIRKARHNEFVIDLLAEQLRILFRSMPGVIVENKHYTLSLHFRRLAPSKWESFHRLFHLLRKRRSRLPLVWREGKMVWEARPVVAWDKGSAVAYLHEHYSPSLPIVLGDDLTDEDMFRAADREGGVSIRVGHSKRSRADYYLSSQREVPRFLEALCR